MNKVIQTNLTLQYTLSQNTMTYKSTVPKNHLRCTTVSFKFKLQERKKKRKHDPNFLMTKMTKIRLLKLEQKSITTLW